MGAVVVYDLKETDRTLPNFGEVQTRKHEFDDFEDAVEFARRIRMPHEKYVVVGIPTVEIDENFSIY